MLRDKISKLAGIPKTKLPSSYQIIGKIFLAKLDLSKPEKKKFAKAVFSLLPYIETVCEIKGIKGELREPIVKKIAGLSTTTIHKEHGIVYKLDVSKLMFSKGNVYERKRLLPLVKKSEIVVDMFAGIGYFSLPIAKKVKKVYAIEKNPTAFRYLKENIKLNRLNNVIPLLSDCRKVKIKEKADHVLMGYFPHTEKFLPYAKSFAKGIIHFHNTYRKDELWNKPLTHIRKVIPKAKILKKKIVKSVAPNIYHVVLDIQINKEKN